MRNIYFISALSFSIGIALGAVFFYTPKAEFKVIHPSPTLECVIKYDLDRQIMDCYEVKSYPKAKE